MTSITRVHLTPNGFSAVSEMRKRLDSLKARTPGATKPVADEDDEFLRLEADAAAQASFAELDTDGDGVISKEEHVAHATAIEQKKAGQTNLH